MYFTTVKNIRTLTYQHVQVLPVVLRHETEGAQQRPAKVVEACVPEVGVIADVLETFVVIGADPTTQDRVNARLGTPMRKHTVLHLILVQDIVKMMLCDRGTCIQCI